MDAVEFLKEKKRMCETISCSSCKLSYFDNGSGQSCTIFIADNPIKAVEEVEKWNKSHPRKTILDDFREKYPNFMYGTDGAPEACVKHLGYIRSCPTSKSCSECWHTPLEELE